jgi:hypothetical protein
MDIFLRVSTEALAMCGLIHHRAARCVHQDGGGLHHAELFCADHVARLRQQRHVQAHEVGFAQQPLGRHELQAQLALQGFRRAHRVVV